MPVNSNTLIHFTDNIDTMRLILSGDFFARMCLEDYHDILEIPAMPRVAIPMICFCDIPLHLISSHMDEYGHYGIGLKKSWAIKNGLNPIQYLHEGTFQHQIILRLNNLLKSTAMQNGNTKDEMNVFWNLLAFTKPYRGISHKNGKPKIFYDEREWRYFPNFFERNSNNANIPMLFEDEFNTNKRDHLNNYLTLFPLKYSLSDIKYIIVKEEQEIPLMISIIDEIESSKYSNEDIQILKTKIISSNYMLDDF